MHTTTRQVVFVYGREFSREWDEPENASSIGGLITYRVDGRIVDPETFKRERDAARRIGGPRG